jgi:hypothetical protein
MLETQSSYFLLDFIYSPSPQPNTTYSGLSRRVKRNEYVSTLARKAFVYFFIYFLF